MADRDQLEQMRRDAAQSALGWKEKVGPGLNEVLSKLKISSDMVNHYHTQSGASQGNDIRMSALDMARNKIQEMYPDWSEGEVDDYLGQATANDPEPSTPATRAAQAKEEGVAVTEDATPRPQARPTTTGEGQGPQEEPPATDGLYPVPSDEEGAKQVESVYHTGEGKRNEEQSRQRDEVAENRRAPQQVGGPSEADDDDTPPWKRRIQNIREAFGMSREPGGQ